MSSEDRLRSMLRSSPAPSTADERDWQEFIGAAHRSRLLHRAAYAAVAVLLVIGGGAGVWAGIERTAERRVPPSDRDVDPAPIPRQVPRDCPEVEPYEPSSTLGAVAFVRDGDLYRVDVRGAEVKLVDGIGEGLQYDVSWSPDGRWISFGNGLIVPAVGGAVCAPLGTGVSEPTWGAGNTLVGQREGLVVSGGPGREAQEISIFDRTAITFALDPDGERAALETNRRTPSGQRLRFAEVWVVDLATGDESLTIRLPRNEQTTPQIAGWSPDGEWILFWRATLSASINADGVPLEAVPTDGGAPVQVTDTMVLRKDFLDWCGDTLVFTDGFGRFETQGHDLATAGAPDWTKDRLTADDSLSWSGPSCSPEADAVASTTVPDGAPLDARRNVVVVSVPDGEVLEFLPPRGPGFDWRNPTQWSTVGDWLLTELRDGPKGTSLILVGWRGTEGRFHNVADLGPEIETFDSKDLYDWYIP